MTIQKVGVIINGAHGKMGVPACETLREAPQFEVLAELGRSDHLADVIRDTKADIVVDLTSADAVYQNTLTIIEGGAHPVIGTSGLLPPEIHELTKLCQEKQLGGLIIPNFSIAAVLMMQFAAEAARYLPNVDIIEAHHPAKAEAPSGTALKTAELIANARRDLPNLPGCREIVAGAMGALHESVRIHSLRLPGTLAEQTVMFGQSGETLSIKHQTMDRASFMPGILLACERVKALNTLVYGLENILS